MFMSSSSGELKNTRKVSFEVCLRSLLNSKNNSVDLSNCSDIDLNDTPLHDDLIDLYSEITIDESSSFIIASMGDKIIKLFKSLECYIREVFIINNLFHPNIISSVGFGLMDSSGFIIYDQTYIQLSDIINYIGGDYVQLPKSFRCHFDTKSYLLCTAIYKIMLQIMDACKYLHTNHIIHADLKPNNILINVSTLQINLVNFNLSIIMLNQKLNANVQSKGFRAPEINTLLDECEYNQSIDMWSCGCILYELIFGRQFNKKPISQFLSDLQNRLKPSNKRRSVDNRKSIILESGSELMEKYIINRAPRDIKEMIKGDSKYAELFNVLFNLLSINPSLRLNASDAKIMLLREYQLTIKDYSAGNITTLFNLTPANIIYYKLTKEIKELVSLEVMVIADFMYEKFVVKNMNVVFSKIESNALNYTCVFIGMVILRHRRLDELILVLTQMDFYEIIVQFIRLIFSQTEFFKNVL